MFQTMNLVRINSLSLKYERFSPTGCKDIGNRTFEFVAKTQFLSHSSQRKAIWLPCCWIPFFFVFLKLLLFFRKVFRSQTKYLPEKKPIRTIGNLHHKIQVNHTEFVFIVFLINIYPHLYSVFRFS